MIDHNWVTRSRTGICRAPTCSIWPDSKSAPFENLNCVMKVCQMEPPTETSGTPGLHTISKRPKTAHLEPGSHKLNRGRNGTKGIYAGLFATIAIDRPLLESRRLTVSRDRYHASLTQVNLYA